MFCRIADLIAEVPEVGDLPSRCREYLYDGMDGADITIRTDLFHMDAYRSLSEPDIIYLESGFQFYGGLLKFDGLMLHASAVVLDGKAYLFSGPCGMGKSTHTRLWQQTFGDAVFVINDDKPALRRIDGTWYAHGTPWCGKDGINRNEKAKLAGICFLRQAPENRIRQMDAFEAMRNIMGQTIHRFRRAETLDLLLENAGKLVKEIPVFELEIRPEPEAARLSYETMCRKAEEMGL